MTFLLWMQKSWGFDPLKPKLQWNLHTKWKFAAGIWGSTSARCCWYTRDFTNGTIRHVNMSLKGFLVSYRNDSLYNEMFCRFLIYFVFQFLNIFQFSAETFIVTIWQRCKLNTRERSDTLWRALHPCQPEMIKVLVNDWFCLVCS